MNDLEFLKKKILSLINKAQNGNVSLLNFVDDAKKSLIINLVKNTQVKACFNGGFINSDYQRCILSLYDVKETDFNIIIYKIIYNKKYLMLHHRNVLGTLMSLGIKRECIGDIIINEEKDAYFACTTEISSYLLNNFKIIGNVGIELIAESSIIEAHKVYEERKHFISSFRLDVIIAAAYNLSRNDVMKIIMAEQVSINHQINTNLSYIVKLNDLISIKHKGRIILKEIGGMTKSSRYFVIIAKQK